MKKPFKDCLADKIAELHERENILNKKNSELDKQLFMIKHEKAKIAKAISKLVLYRNNQIDYWSKL